MISWFILYASLASAKGIQCLDVLDYELDRRNLPKYFSSGLTRHPKEEVLGGYYNRYKKILELEELFDEEKADYDKDPLNVKAPFEQTVKGMSRLEVIHNLREALQPVDTQLLQLGEIFSTIQNVSTKKDTMRVYFDDDQLRAYTSSILRHDALVVLTNNCDIKAIHLLNPQDMSTPWRTYSGRMCSMLETIERLAPLVTVRTQTLLSQAELCEFSDGKWKNDRCVCRRNPNRTIVPADEVCNEELRKLQATRAMDKIKSAGSTIPFSELDHWEYERLLKVCLVYDKLLKGSVKQNTKYKEDIGSRSYNDMHD